MVSMLKQFYFEQFSLALRSLNFKTVLFQAIQFRIITQFSSLWPINRTLSDATTQGQSRLRSDSDEGVLRIPQPPCIAGTSSSFCLGSHQDTRWGDILPCCIEAVGVLYSLRRQGNRIAYIYIILYIIFGE